ncbi:MAG: sterol desaturase family protein [Nannocystaceae bacterium]|nr:sterol desaturase family protein [Nannocystaceae bacterium]
MSDNIIPLLVPFFILGIVVEALVARRRKQRAYHLGTMVSDLSTGIVSQVFEVFFKFAAVVAYGWLYDHARLVEFASGSPWPWLIAFVGIDFAFYWWHRLSHVVNVLWGVHVVHHHSEDFNLSVALRQPALELVSAFVFYAPLALLGVPAHVWVTMYALNLFYQFWTHTELVRQLGPIEAVLNTPSHHRVHHGINPQYLDKNYGGIFILWDKLFGTYEPEREPVVFGVTKPLHSYNPLWANVEYYVQVQRAARRFPRWLDRVRVWWMHPGWQPATLGPATPPAAVDRAQYVKYEASASRPLRRYVLAHFWLAFAGSGLYMSLEATASRSAMILPGVVVLATLLALVGRLERRGWAVPLDVARQLATVAMVAYYGSMVASPVAAAGGALGLALLFVALWLWHRRHDAR